MSQRRMKTESRSDNLAEFIRDNHSEIANVLRQSQDPYTRACALVLLREGGTERDVKKVKDELDQWS